MTDIQTLTAAATLQDEGLAQAARVQLTLPSGVERVVDLPACQVACLEVFHRSEPDKHFDRKAIALQLIRYCDTRNSQMAAQGQFSQVAETSASKTNVAFKGIS